MITIPHATEAIRMQAFQMHIATQPITIQPLQTQQKQGVTEAWHNAEKHSLFQNVLSGNYHSLNLSLLKVAELC